MWTVEDKRHKTQGNQGAQMQTYWTLSFVSTLLSMTLLVVTMGQYQTLTTLTTALEKMEKQSDDRFNDFSREELLSIRLRNQVNAMHGSLRNLQTSLANISAEMIKKNEADKACWNLKKKQTDQLASQEKELSNVKGTIKAESDAWEQEIRTLNAQLHANSPICDYVKRSLQSDKLCIATKG